MQDLSITPKYLVTFTVGYDQKKNIDAAVKKVGPLSLPLYVYFSYLSHCAEFVLTVFRELYYCLVSL